MTLNKAVSHATVIFLWAFCTEFSPEEEALNRLRDQLVSVRESVVAGALTIPEIRKALKDDYDLEV